MPPLFIRLLVLVRHRQLQRQLRCIERRLARLSPAARTRLSTMTLREIGQAADCDFPHLYGTPPGERYLPWGQGTHIGFSRACSDNAELALRGTALWLAAAYHETKDAQHPPLQALHRHLLRLVRELKALHTRTGTPRVARSAADWMQPNAAA